MIFKKLRDLHRNTNLNQSGMLANGLMINNAFPDILTTQSVYGFNFMGSQAFLQDRIH